MSGQHAQGQLEFRISHYEPEAYDLTAVGIGAVALVKNEANARRLVACWNAFDGFSTEEIESMVAAGGIRATDLMMKKALAEIEDIKKLVDDFILK